MRDASTWAAALVLALSLGATATMRTDLTAADGSVSARLHQADEAGDPLLDCTFSPLHDGAPCARGTATSSPLTPGVPVSTWTTVTNVSTRPRLLLSLHVKNPCTVTRGPADLCDRIHLRISSTSQTFFNGTAQQLADRGDVALAALAPKSALKIDITTELDESVDNSYQDAAVSNPITWVVTQE